MNKYEFSIIASGLDPEAEDFEQRFYDAGCDDATVSFQKGHIILDFAREAESIDVAIASAVECVESVGAEVDRVEPDPLVSLSDIAERTGMSRSAMTLYAKGRRNKEFPAPVARVTSESPLWDWATVATWLYKNEKLSRAKAIEAAVVKAANAAIEAHEHQLANTLRTQAKEYEACLEAA
jgi:predicted DNA-binding transcriptional regulator AlpA